MPFGCEIGVDGTAKTAGGAGGGFAVSKKIKGQGHAGFRSLLKE